MSPSVTIRVPVFVMLRYSRVGRHQRAGVSVHRPLSLQPLRPGRALHPKPSPPRPLPRHGRSPELPGDVRGVRQPGRVALRQR